MLKILEIDEADFNKIYLLSDIHGNLELLKKMIKKIKLESEDLLIILGDSCDRGEKSGEVFQYIWEISCICKVIHLRGNHEEMMERALVFQDDTELWMLNGGGKTIESLKGNIELTDKILDYIYTMPDIVVGKSNIFVHGGIDFSKAIDQQKREYTLWTRDEFWMKNRSKKNIFFGHTVQKNGRISYFPQGAVGIDCGTYKNKILACIEVKSGKEYYVGE